MVAIERLRELFQAVISSIHIHDTDKLRSLATHLSTLGEQARWDGDQRVADLIDDMIYVISELLMNAPDKGKRVLLTIEQRLIALERLPRIQELLEWLDQHLARALKIKDGGDRLDELRQIAAEAEQWLANLSAAEKEITREELARWLASGKTEGYGRQDDPYAEDWAEMVIATLIHLLE